MVRPRDGGHICHRAPPGRGVPFATPFGWIAVDEGSVFAARVGVCCGVCEAAGVEGVELGTGVVGGFCALRRWRVLIGNFVLTNQVRSLISSRMGSHTDKSSIQLPAGRKLGARQRSRGRGTRETNATGETHRAHKPDIDSTLMAETARAEVDLVLRRHRQELAHRRRGQERHLPRVSCGARTQEWGRGRTVRYCSSASRRSR